jgi:uncharacterized protein YjdB
MRTFATIAAIVLLGVLAGCETGTGKFAGVGNGDTTISIGSSASVATISIAPDSGSFAVGSTIQLAATTRDAQGAVLTGRVVNYTSSDAAIASVTSAGVVTALRVGTVTITAESEHVSVAAHLRVVP